MKVSLTIINGDKGPVEKMLLNQLPDTAKKPLPKQGKQLDIFSAP